MSAIYELVRELKCLWSTPRNRTMFWTCRIRTSNRSERIPMHAVAQAASRESAAPNRSAKEPVSAPAFDSAAPLTAYLEGSNPACKLVYVDATPMSINVGATIYRDIVLSAEVPLGTPPCEPGAPASVPPAKK